MSLKKKRIPPTFPCSCGHDKKTHGWAGPTIGDEWCNGYSNNSIKFRNHRFSYPCECEQFVADNLKYLEQCANKKKGKKQHDK